MKRRPKSPISAARWRARRGEYEAALMRWKYGSLGAASPVRRIDPKTGPVIEGQTTPDDNRRS